MELNSLVSEIEKTGLTLNELAVWQNGQTQVCRFRPGDHCTNGYSVAKAFTMTAVGMLWDEGKIDVTKPIADYMGSLMPADIDPKWQEVTVEHALTHTIGFENGFLDIDVEDVLSYPTEDYLDIVFRHPIVYQPGTHRQYSDAAFYLLSRLVSCISGEKLDDFLNARLFRPLHFHEFAWSHCPMNYPMGATGLYASAGDMIKLPVLYMNGGVWEGKRLLSREWIDLAIAREYELHPRTPAGWIGKGGMYGQIVLFNREKNAAIAWLGHTNDSGPMVQRLLEVLDKEL